MSGLLAKKRDVDLQKAKVIICPDGVLPKYVASSNIFYIQTDTTTGYLRAVFHHTSYKKCILEAVETWFTELHPEQRLECDSVRRALNDRKNRKKFFNMGNEDDPQSRSRKFYETKDANIVGITIPREIVVGSEDWKVYINNIKALLRYVRNTICRYRRNQRGGKWEFSGVNRQEATVAVAKLLGLDYMFPQTEWVVVKYKNKELFGLLMEVAEGENSGNVNSDRRHAIVSPIMQRDLISLNMLDVITFERDHRPGNYNIVVGNKNKASRISVFDNDAEMTFAPFPAKIQSSHGSSCFFTRDGKINRPYLDKRVAEKVLDLQLSELRQTLRPYLNFVQIIACCNRVRSVQKAIRKTMVDRVFLLEYDEWSEATMSEELSGQYGRTYLEMFVNWESIIKPFMEYAHQVDL